MGPQEDVPGAHKISDQPANEPVGVNAEIKPRPTAKFKLTPRPEPAKKLEDNMMNPAASRALTVQHEEGKEKEEEEEEEEDDMKYLLAKQLYEGEDSVYLKIPAVAERWKQMKSTRKTKARQNKIVQSNESEVNGISPEISQASSPQEGLMQELIEADDNQKDDSASESTEKDGNVTRFIENDDDGAESQSDSDEEESIDFDLAQLDRIPNAEEDEMAEPEQIEQSDERQVSGFTPVISRASSPYGGAQFEPMDVEDIQEEVLGLVEDRTDEPESIPTIPRGAYPPWPADELAHFEICFEEKTKNVDSIPSWNEFYDSFNPSPPYSKRQKEEMLETVTRSLNDKFRKWGTTRYVTVLIRMNITLTKKTIAFLRKHGDVQLTNGTVLTSFRLFGSNVKLFGKRIGDLEVNPTTDNLHKDIIHFLSFLCERDITTYSDQGFVDKFYELKNSTLDKEYLMNQLATAKTKVENELGEGLPAGRVLLATKNKMSGISLMALQEKHAVTWEHIGAKGRSGQNLEGLENGAGPSRAPSSSTSQHQGRNDIYSDAPHSNNGHEKRVSGRKRKLEAHTNNQ